jgi:hypothetical protein
MGGGQDNRSATNAIVRAARVIGLGLLFFGMTAYACHADAPPPAVIDHVSNVDSAGNPVAGNPNDVPVELNGKFAIVLTAIDPAAKIVADNAVLLLNGRPITGLKDTQYLVDKKALIFHLVRNSDNADDWTPLLGSPSLTPRSVAVGLWLEKPSVGAAPPHTIANTDGSQPAIKLVLISTIWAVAAVVAILLVLVAVWAAAANTNILKDSLLPQLAPKEQPFSLGRSQMAFWFTLIFGAFVALYVLLWDYNTLTTQALVLMGLSGATTIFAVAIDAAKDTPIGAANETLRAIGINTYRDVVQLDQEISVRQIALKNTPATDTAAILKLQTEITDRLNKKRAWHEITRPFVSAGWYRDLTTDINGPALHRLQMFVWTLAIGVLFVIDVYRNLALPQFSTTLLTLMGITNAGYLGFKYPEQQN